MRTVKIFILTLVVSFGLFALYSSVKNRKDDARPAPASQPPAQDTLNVHAPSAPAVTETRQAGATATPVTVAPVTAITTAAAELAAPSVAPPSAVAMVNGVAITKGELEAELNRLLMSPASHEGMKSEKKDELRKTALDELIVRELAYQRAKGRGLVVGERQFAATVRKIKRRYKNDEGFKKALVAEEITEREFERRVEKDLLLRKVLKLEIEDKSRVTEALAQKHYEENREKFVVPESIHLKNIVVKIEPGREEEAKRKIDDIYTKLKAGGDFAELAYRLSDDDYRVMGGDYGWAHRGQLNAELEAVAFAARVKELVGPFRTSMGWHIVSVEGRQPERQLAYEEVEEKIKKSLRRQRESQQRQDFIAKLKAGAKIEYVKL